MPFRLFQPTYSRDDCTFREKILSDGYNIYVSDKHRVLLSLGNHRQRLQGRDRGVPALAQFLPRFSTLDQSLTPGLEVPGEPGQNTAETEEEPVDTFGKLYQIIHSPSFHKRWGSSSDSCKQTCPLLRGVLLFLSLSSTPSCLLHNQGLTACPASLHPGSTVLSDMTKQSTSADSVTPTFISIDYGGAEYDTDKLL